MKNFYLAFFLLLASLCPSGVYAGTMYKSVVICRHDRTSLKVNLADDVNASIKNGNLLFSCSKGDISLPVSEVGYWFYSTEPGSDEHWAGIDNIGADNVLVTFDGDMLLLSNLPGGMNVAIYDVEGRCLHSAAVDASEVEINVSSYVPGVYVAVYGNKSFKFVRR